MKKIKKSLHLNLPVYFDRHQGNLTACTYHTTNNAKARSIKMWVWYSSSGQNRSKKFHPSERHWGIDAGLGRVHQYWKTSHHVVFMKNRSKKNIISKKLRERGAQVSLQLYGLLCCYTGVRGEQKEGNHLSVPEEQKHPPPWCGL